MAEIVVLIALTIIAAAFVAAVWSWIYLDAGRARAERTRRRIQQSRNLEKHRELLELAREALTHVTAPPPLAPDLYELERAADLAAMRAEAVEAEAAIRGYVCECAYCVGFRDSRGEVPIKASARRKAKGT